MRTLLAGIVAGAAVTSGLAIGAGPASAATPSCAGSAIRVGHNHPQGATGHGNVIIRFRNISKHTCSLHGYPGLDALAKNGHVLAHAKRTLNGFTGGAHAVRTIVLKPDALASADVEWVNFGANGRNCTFSHSIATTPANTAHTVHFALSVSVCSLQVHPTVAGASGNAR